ncbi:competence protein CoiA family protein [Streptomyces decoyicus]
MKERIARAADRHGLTAEVEARSTDGRVRNDVLVTGHAERIGWEAQYSPITEATVRRRSQAAADLDIPPVGHQQRPSGLNQPGPLGPRRRLLLEGHRLAPHHACARRRPAPTELEVLPNG